MAPMDVEDLRRGIFRGPPSWGAVAVILCLILQNGSALSADGKTAGRCELNEAQRQQLHREGERDWYFLRHSVDREELEAFLMLYPDSRHAASARDRLANLEIDGLGAEPAFNMSPAERIWHLVNFSADPATYRRYLLAFPAGRYSPAARTRLHRLCPQDRPGKRPRP